MAGHRAGSHDAVDLEGMHITSKHNRIRKTPVQLIRTRDLSRKATSNLDKILHLESLQRDVRRAHKALHEFLYENPDHYVYRPTTCSASSSS